MPRKSIETRKTTRPQPTAREPPPVPERVCYTSFEDLSNDAVKSLPAGWVILQRNTSQLQIGLRLSSGQDQWSILVVIEAQHFLADVKVLDIHGAHLQADLETKKLGSFLRELQAQAMCPGITNPSLQQFAGHPDGKTGYFQHIRYSFEDGKMLHTSCVRSVQCELLIETDKSYCRSCQSVQDILQEKLARHETVKAIKPNDSLRGLSKKQLKEAFKAERKKNFVKQAEEFKARIPSESVDLPEDLHNDLQQAMGSLQDPLQRLFWEEQLKAFEKKEHGMRWHPMMIRLAILIHSKSEAAYETLRKTGVLKLPGKSTLREYTAATESKSGFQPEVVDELKKYARQLPENQRFVVLLHDEMTIKSDLVFESRSGQLVGFVHSDKDCGLKPNRKLATHALVFYAVGINSNLKMSLGFFPTKSATADQLYSLFWQAVACLEEAGFKVVVSTSDKAPPNQRLYQMMGDPDQVVYRTVNLLTPERWIFLISDPPHLIKTVRNNLSSSAEGPSTRCLWNNAHHILWKHFSRLYHQDMEMGVARSGLTLQHIRLNPHSVMNVRLAAQTLSSRVAAAMQTYGGLECQETATFVKLMDRFFDCLNTRHLHEAEHKRKPDLRPYTDANDERFRFLQEDFLGYLFQWKASVENRPGFSRAEKAKMYLTYQTHRGLVMTVNGFIEATRFLLTNGVRFLLSNKFCQDPIEEHFGRQGNGPHIRKSQCLALCPPGKVSEASASAGVYRHP
ncbi:uncharacterized protein [Littorina saxatilis]|uniref:Transposable element P transposase n=1 Tax=Littorina saxatilis TaxID=31220 RepID=A0AAN9G0H2_9CAEN